MGIRDRQGLRFGRRCSRVGRFDLATESLLALARRLEEALGSCVGLARVVESVLDEIDAIARRRPIARVVFLRARQLLA
jgi:hypothetical protein